MSDYWARRRNSTGNRGWVKRLVQMCSHARTVAFMTMAGTLFIGCTVGPDFQRPDAPISQSYTAAPLPRETASAPEAGGAGQRFIFGGDIPAQWWTLFRSEPLDALIRQALTASPTLAAARATLRQAQELRHAQSGALYPSVDANLRASRQKISGASLGQGNDSSDAFNLFNASVDVSYTLDVAGGVHRELELLQAQVDYERFQLEGAGLTLTSNIVTTTVKEMSLRAQYSAQQEILATQEKYLRAVEEQFRVESISRSDVLAQQAQIAQTRATLPPLRRDIAQTRHLLAVLLGKFPSEAGTLPEFTLDSLQLPDELPVSLPSALVRQRPDIRASEELLHAASAQVGVATANLYPRITLTGSFGLAAGTVGTLFGTGAPIFSLGAGLLQPLFHGGQLTAQRRAAIAAYDQAAAQYQTTILKAFQDVADVLHALDADALALKAQSEAASAARDLLDITRKQFNLGAVSYLSLLNAERQYQQTQVSLVQAQAARFADTAALFQALGGGWWNGIPMDDAVPVAGGD